VVVLILYVSRQVVWVHLLRSRGTTGVGWSHLFGPPSARWVPGVTSSEMSEQGKKVVAALVEAVRGVVRARKEKLEVNGGAGVLSAWLSGALGQCCGGSGMRRCGCSGTEEELRRICSIWRSGSGRCT
jgi:hypothetical protein